MAFRSASSIDFLQCHSADVMIVIVLNQQAQLGLIQGASHNATALSIMFLSSRTFPENGMGLEL